MSPVRTCGIALIPAVLLGTLLGLQSTLTRAKHARELSEADVAEAAMLHLRGTKEEPLSGRLTEILAKAKDHLSKNEPHPLIGKVSPSIRLTNTDGDEVELDDLLAKGPVVLVFYLGYACDHCVSQLFGLNEDLAYFSELGATIVAVSEDMPSKTREKYKKYGAFSFPVLSDPTHEAAQRFGVYTPAGNGRRAWEAHGTFVIGKDRKILWANTGSEPFTDNPTLLFEIAGSLGRAPR